MPRLGLMTCPVCGQAGPGGANFCFACGAALARICPTCQAGQPSGARFCAECGTAFGGPAGGPPAGVGEVETIEVDEPPVAAEWRPDRRRGRAVVRVRRRASRRRESRRTVAVVTSALLLALGLVGGAALSMRTAGSPPLEGAALHPGVSPGGAAPVAIVPSPEPAAPSTAPEPAAPPTAPEPPAPPKATAAPPAVAAAPEPAPDQPTAPALPPRLPAPARALRELDRPRAESRTARVVPPEPAGGRPAPPSSVMVLPRGARSDMGVHVAAEPLGEGVTFYTVKLRERDGAPVTGAEVVIRGRRPDGTVVQASLDPAGDAGVYEAALRPGDLFEPRLRVTSAGRIQEQPLASVLDPNVAPR